MKKELYNSIIKELEGIKEKYASYELEEKVEEIIVKIKDVKLILKEDIKINDVLFIVFLGYEEILEEYPKEKKLLSSIKNIFTDKGYDVETFDNFVFSNDMDYDEMKIEVKRIKKYNAEKNVVGQTIKVIAIFAIIVGFLIGTVAGINSDSFVLSLTIYAYTFFVSLALLYYAEHLFILHDIRRKLYK